MSNAKKLRTLILAGIGLLCSVGFAQAELYEVLIEDLIEGGPEMGQPFTPPLVVVHGAGYSLFAEGDFATAGLEALAEDGVTADLEAEALASPDVYDVEIGSGPFFGSALVEIEGTPGDLLSLVTMLARSNDLFTGVADVVLPAAGSVVIEPTGVYDAGTEENTGLVEHIPFYGNPFMGPDEDNPIAMISSYEVGNDEKYGVIRFEFPPSARITIRVLEGTPADFETWGAIKALYR